MPGQYNENFPVRRKETFEKKGCDCSCKEISEHIENCPICKKLYKNNNCVLNIVIIILLVANLMGIIILNVNKRV